MSTESAESIYSIGHSRHPIEDFISLLQKHQVEIVVDVRGQPYSRHNPQFNRERLEAALKACGMKYSWRGEFLSGRPGPRRFYGPDGKVLWDDLSKWPALHRAVDELCEDIQTQRTAMMCAEEDPNHCHRRFLLTPALMERGVLVEHIRGDGRRVSEKTLRAEEPPDQISLFS